MKKIFFERTGGFMGRKVSVAIDMDELPDEQVDLLEDLVDEADFFELPTDLTGSATPDAFTYNITISSDKGQHSVRCSDSTVPDDLRPLLDELSKRARMR